MHDNRLKFYIGGSVLALTLIFLGYRGFSGSTAYYLFVDEISGLGDEAYETPLKINGQVTPGSLNRAGVVEFAIQRNGASVKVIYVGKNPLPDMFKEGAEIVAEGRLKRSGVFEARSIQTKCASKYEARDTTYPKSIDFR